MNRDMWYSKKQGIVHPTKMVNKMPVNDDSKLEAQCDIMMKGTPVMQHLNRPYPIVV